MATTRAPQRTGSPRPLQRRSCGSRRHRGEALGPVPGRGASSAARSAAGTEKSWLAAGWLVGMNADPRAKLPRRRSLAAFLSPPDPSVVCASRASGHPPVLEEKVGQRKPRRFPHYLSVWVWQSGRHWDALFPTSRARRRRRQEARMKHVERDPCARSCELIGGRLAGNPCAARSGSLHSAMAYEWIKCQRCQVSAVAAQQN